MKSSMYVGFKQQIEQFEPLEIGASVEIEHDDDVDVNDKLTAIIMKRLEEQSTKIATSVAVIKKRIINELSDEEEGEEEGWE